MSGKPDAWSLKRRLAIRLFAVVLLGALAPTAVIIIGALVTLDTMNDRALQDQAADIVRSLDLGVSPPIFKLPPRLAEDYRRSRDSFLYAVLPKAGGEALAASSPTAAAVLEQAREEPVRTFFVVPDMERGSVWYAYAIPAGDQLVVVAQGDRHRDALADSVVRGLVQYAWAAVIPMLLATLLVARWTLNRAFREVEASAAAVRAIVPGTADVRLPEDGLPDEIRPLASAANGAFEQLARAYEMERRFTADAAHEMRTPLAVLTARIDAMPPSQERTALAQDAARLNRLVAQMLSAVRLETAPLGNRMRIDLAKTTIDAVAALGPLAIREGRRLELKTPPEPVHVLADAQILALGITNLVENAIVHTAAPSPVEIEIAADGVIRVLDRGSGIPADERDAIFERFRRGRNVGSSGSGLGLAIVREVATRHGGTVSVEERAGGGSVFTLQLPLDPTAQAG